MSASGYFAMYGSGSFSLHASLMQSACILHISPATDLPQSSVVHARNPMLSGVAALLALGTRGKGQGKCCSPDGVHI